MSNASAVTLREAAELLCAADSVLVVGHTGADGDAMGSALATAHLCRSMGKEVRVALPEACAERLSFLQYNKWEELTPEAAERYSVICAVDVASAGQLGSLSWLARSEKVSLILDHHGTGEPFAPHFVDPGASSAGEIVWRLYCLLRESGKVPALPEVSRGVYAAILSDTGSFKFSNVTPDTHRIAAELVEEINTAQDGGMSTEELCRALFGRRTMGDLKAQALAISRLTLHAEGRLGAVLLTRADIEGEGLTDADVSGAVEVPRSLEGVEIAIAMRQSADEATLYKISSRSNTDANVAELCALLGGGGHAKAAGCSIRGESPEGALKAAVKHFAKGLS